ncbi:MAG: DUF6804 family protein [Ignavibacteria bacterium]|nr:hypothetical protein [Ignavibacteria bacterium]
MVYRVVNIIAVILLFWSLDRHPYSYYTLLRFVVFGVSVYSVYLFITIKKSNWAWIHIMIAILFNPIFPIYLDRNIWRYVDIAAAIVFLVSLYVLKKSVSENNNNESPEK